MYCEQTGPDNVLSVLLSKRIDYGFPVKGTFKGTFKGSFTWRLTSTSGG